MGLTVAELSAQLGLDTVGFDRGISGVLGKMKPIGGAALGASAIAVGAVTAIGVGAYKMGAEFDKAYDTIRIGTGATGAQLDGLKSTFKDVVTDVPTDFGTASTAIADLNTRLGLTGDQLRDASGQFLELSRLTGTDVASNVRLGTRLFGDWSIATEKQADALDLVFRATQASGVGLNDLMETVVQFGAPLRNIGFQFEESIAMLAKWEREGVNVETALTGMRFALKTFAAEGTDPRKGLPAVIAEIQKLPKLKAMDLGRKIFGLRAFSDVVAAIREGRFKYEDMLEVISEGEDTIHGAAKDVDDLSESWSILWSTIKTKVEPAATGFFGLLSEIVADPFALKYAEALDIMLDATDELTKQLPKQWGQAALRTRDLLEDLDRLLAEPRILGDLDGEHTQGQLRDIRNDIRKQLEISVNETNELMLILFDDFNPEEGLVRPMRQSLAQVEAANEAMRDELARNIRHGKYDNKALIKKIEEGEAREAKMRRAIKKDLKAGKLNLDDWTTAWDRISAQYEGLRSRVESSIRMGGVSGHGGRKGGGQYGGTFSGPKSGYLVPLHGEETIVAHDDPTLGLSDLVRYGIIKGGAGAAGELTINSNVVLPGGTVLAGTAREISDFIAPYVARTLEKAMRQQARRHN